MEELHKLVVGLATLGPGIGIGLIAAAYCNSVARQPEVQGSLFPHAFVFIGMVELLGFLGLLALFL